MVFHIYNGSNGISKIPYLLICFIEKVTSVLICRLFRNISSYASKLSDNYA